MNHGRGAHAKAAQVVDPVCSMTIEPADAAGTSDVAGNTYHFRSPACKRKFDADPSRFGVKVDGAGSCEVGHGCRH